MAITMSISPAVLRLGKFLSLSVVIGLYTAILVDVKKGKDIALCVSNKTLEKTCWDGNISNTGRTLKCPFTLIYTTIILLSFALVMFFMSGIVKCLFPEVVLLINRTPICCKITQYYSLSVHVLANCFAVAFVVFMALNSFTKNSCYYSADIVRNCTHRRSLCWMFAFVLMGFVSGIVAMVCSFLEARKFYRERLEDEMCDQLYNEYLIDPADAEQDENLRSWPPP